MKRWIGLIVLAVLLWGAATFGLAALAVEWRDDDISRLSDHFAELRDDVRDLRTAIERPGEATPSPTATAEPVIVAAAVGATAELDGMRLTMTALDPRRHWGRADFLLENVGAPEAQVDAIRVQVVNFRDFVCDTEAQLPVLTLRTGDKVGFSATWTCPNAPPRLVSVGNVTFALPTVPKSAR
jgi:hypothetical protein